MMWGTKCLVSPLILVWFVICKLINLYDNINDDSNSNIDTIITAEGGGGGGQRNIQTRMRMNVHTTRL